MFKYGRCTLVASWLLLSHASEAVTQSASPIAPLTNVNPSWSPDGRQIVFETRRHGRAQLYVINADGTGERRLTRSLGDDTHPAWSPDGSTIVFDSIRDGTTWNESALYSTPAARRQEDERARRGRPAPMPRRYSSG